MNTELKFNSNGTFKILQFTDIHYSNDNELDHGTTKLMEQILKAEKPDFIMITGDTVYGPDNISLLSKALLPVTDAGVPWSFTFGNHDTEEGAGYDKLFDAFTRLSNCAAFNADDSISGMGNHYLEVKDWEDNTKWLLFGIDSGAYNQLPQVEGYDYVKDSQIHWYKKVVQEFEKKADNFSALVFMHIALPEYNEVWDTRICYGDKREEVCAPKINSGFFTAMLETGHTKAVFVGHDHINDYIGDLYGILLGYGRATGYNTYGQEGYLRGARIIVLNENNTESFQTYIRLEDGIVLQEQMIHQPEKQR
ncbi:metallophosphoesterase family protein [Anaerocolumna sp. MB42-C2]|uniref:metallophosphoesterase family protein n=1 Tax=Anaerocolumna sp. MB42-C2 TaxID=3070997 RepID=UPI0027DF1952|nr:metallophosphoesterase family protein [Anaerocolumna sp. MB42-C2]WMJ86681.1 metallophosphoesterase family protein [Anaerocolumna sp. MB42-C2]